MNKEFEKYFNELRNADYGHCKFIWDSAIIEIINYLEKYDANTGLGRCEWALIELRGLKNEEL